MAFLFSYGTLQRPDVQLELFGRLLPGTSDSLAGYRVERIEITDEAFLEKDEDRFQKILVHTGDQNDIVKGMALELSEKEISEADKYEPVNYKRVFVTLVSGKHAWVYVESKE